MHACAALQSSPPHAGAHSWTGGGSEEGGPNFIFDRRGLGFSGWSFGYGIVTRCGDYRARAAELRRGDEGRLMAAAAAAA